MICEQNRNLEPWFLILLIKQKNGKIKYKYKSIIFKSSYEYRHKTAQTNI